MAILSLSERKVISLLEKDARATATFIAKKSRLSSEGVIKIINRLQEAGIILRFNTKINYSRMGYEIYAVHMRLFERNKNRKKTLLKILKNNKNFAWYAFCEGEYDLMVSFRISSEQEKAEMTKTLAMVSGFLAEKDVSIVVSSYEIAKSFIDTKESNALFTIINSGEEPVVMKEDDLKLVDLLRRNCRFTVLELANLLNTTPRVITTQRKRLEKMGIIRGYTLKLDMAALGFQPFRVLIALGSHDEEEIREFITYCRFTKGVHYIIRQIGKYDIELAIDVNDVSQFHLLLNELRNKFDFVKKITTLVTDTTE